MNGIRVFQTIPRTVRFVPHRTLPPIVGASRVRIAYLIECPTFAGSQTHND